MRKFMALTAAGLLALATISQVMANPSPPTNGGSANGGGQSGQCTGANDERPASCHNGNGAGN